MRKFIDVGANLTDPMYRGIYHSSTKHGSDLNEVIQRSYSNNVTKLIITGTDLEDSKIALKMSKNDVRLFSTVGCHPTKCNKFEESGDSVRYFNDLRELILQNVPKVVAVGECGLDYDRLHFCQKDVQQKYFEKQLNLCRETKLPLFLHCRNAANDFINLIKKQDYPFEGVLHSFDGSIEDLNSVLDLGFYIGINGCSLKTEENLRVVRNIPQDKLLLETDCPWCEVKPSHAGYKYVKTHFESIKKEKWKEGKLVKGRNEPCTITQILEIVSAVRDEDFDELCHQVYSNTLKLFRNLTRV